MPEHFASITSPFGPLQRACSQRRAAGAALAQHVALCLLSSVMAACAGEEARTLPEQADDSSVSATVTADEVVAAQAYLRKYGYFPDPELAREYPSWRPLLDAEPSAGVYDSTTERAVRELQRRHGLPESGWLDAKTRELMQQSRCAVPEGVATPAQHDDHEKFALNGGRWNKRNLTWKLLNTDDVTFAQAQQAIDYATFMWAYETDLTFTQVTNGGSADIVVRFKSIDGAGNALAQGGTSGTLNFDTAEKWSVASTTPRDSYDLYTTALHEMGHVLGLSHTTHFGNIMFPLQVAGDQMRLLGSDDAVAISALYDQFWSVPGLANDIAAGADGSVWHIGTAAWGDGYRIYKWTPSGWWEASGQGGAFRIAVAPDGTPWVVTTTGTIWTHSRDHTAGTWQIKPGCAKDIGIGSEGSVWVVGCDLENPNDQFSGYRIHKWNGVDGWHQDFPGSRAIRISVDEKGRPWVVTVAFQVRRRTSTNLSTAGWTFVEGINAYDIAVSPQGYAWAVGTETTTGGHKVYVRNDQVSSSDPSLARNVWIRTAGGAFMIAAGPRAVWIADSNLNILKQGEKSLF